MDLAIKIVIGAIALLFLFMGANLMFAPAAAAEGFALTPIGVEGLNTLRADLGGMFITGTALLILGLLQKKSEWFLAVAVLMAIIACGRLVGFVMDGGASSATLSPFVAELVIAAILVFASRRLPAG